MKGEFGKGCGMLVFNDDEIVSFVSVTNGCEYGGRVSKA